MKPLMNEIIIAQKWNIGELQHKDESTADQTRKLNIDNH